MGREAIEIGAQKNMVARPIDQKCRRSKKKKNPSSMTGCALKKMATTHKEKKKESAPLVSKSLISIT